MNRREYAKVTVEIVLTDLGPKEIGDATDKIKKAAVEAAEKFMLGRGGLVARVAAGHDEGGAR